MIAKEALRSPLRTGALNVESRFTAEMKIRNFVSTAPLLRIFLTEAILCLIIKALQSPYTGLSIREEKSMRNFMQGVLQASMQKKSTG